MSSGGVRNNQGTAFRFHGACVICGEEHALNKKSICPSCSMGRGKAKDLGLFDPGLQARIDAIVARNRDGDRVQVRAVTSLRVVEKY